MKKILTAGLLGGLVMFLWGAVAHVALPIGEMGLAKVPNEAPLLDAMRAGVPESGVYYFPKIDADDPSSEEQAAWEQKALAGPSGLLVYTQSGGGTLTPGKLAVEFLTNLGAALIAAAMLAGKPGTWLCRTLGVGSLGVLAWLSISASESIWYGFSTAFSIGTLLEQAIGWTLTGAVIAIVVPKGECKP